mgnify:FL=1
MMTFAEILREVYPVSDEAAFRLARHATMQSYARKERMVNQGKPCSYVFFIASGLCRCVYEGEDKEDTRWFASPGDVLTSVTSYHTGEPAIFSIEAITPVECYAIPYTVIRAFVTEDSEIHAWVFKLLLEQLYVLERRYVIIGTGSAISRYAAFMRGRPREMIRQIPLKFIAQYLDMSQETLSRVRNAYARGKLD